MFSQERERERAVFLFFPPKVSRVGERGSLTRSIFVLCIIFPAFGGREREREDLNAGTESEERAHARDVKRAHFKRVVENESESERTKFRRRDKRQPFTIRGESWLVRPSKREKIQKTQSGESEKKGTTTTTTKKC